MMSLTQEASLIGFPELERKTTELYKLIRETMTGEIKPDEQKSKQISFDSPRDLMSSPSSKIDFLKVSKQELRRKASDTGDELIDNNPESKMISNLARVPKSREYFNVNFFDKGGFILPQIINIFKDNFGAYFDQSKALEFFERLKQVNFISFSLRNI